MILLQYNFKIPFMNRLISFLFLLTLITGISESTFSQQARNTVELSSFFVGDGDVSLIVQDIAQDNDNFIWMATWNGLEKFDGYTFRNFKSYPNDSVRLAFNRLASITPGPGHILWCETYDSKLYIFDTESERFIDFFALHPEIKPSDGIVGRFPLSGGIIWLISRDGSLWRIDSNSYSEPGSVKYFKPSSTDADIEVFGIYPDGKGGEWILTDRGYNVFGRNDINGTEIYRQAVLFKDKFVFISDDGTITLTSIDTGKSIPIKTDVRFEPSTSPLILSDKRIALSTARSIEIFNPETLKHEHITLPLIHYPIEFFHEQTDPNGKQILWALTTDGKIIRVDLAKQKAELLDKPYSDKTDGYELQFIHQDNSGEIWIYPRSGHMLHYNAATRNMERVYTYSNQGKRLVPDFLFHIKDDRNNIWGYTKQGVYKLSFPSEYAHSLQGQESECRALMIDSKNRLWSGHKNHTVAVYDSAYHYIGNLSLSGEIRKDMSLSFGASVYTMTEDSKGRIWLGSRNDGLFVATPTGFVDKYTIRNFRHNPDDISSLSSNAIYSVFEDKNKRIWIGTYGGGLNLVHESDKGTLEFKNSVNGGLPTFPGEDCSNVRYVTSSYNGTMMLATSNGLVTFDSNFNDPSKIRFYRNQFNMTRNSTISNSDVLYVMEDSKKDVYLAVMAGGICKISHRNLLSDTLSFTYINKHSGLPNDMVYSIREDQDGKLWIAVENAICRYDPESEKVEVFNSKDFNRPFQVGEGPFVIDSKGIATIGLENSLMQIDLLNLQKCEYIPNVVFYEAYMQSKKGDEKTIRIKDDVLNIESDYRNLSISFVALDYTDPTGIFYSYRLKGFNDNWTDNGHNHTASFYALPAGDYVLEVRASNSQGAWSDKIYRLTLHIEPNFIETVWAKILYILGFIAIFFAIWYVTVYILRLQRRLDMEQELSELKLKFFTDISHELRTPLTLIINPIDEVLADKALSDTSREYMSLAKSNTNRMLKLITQFLDIRKIQNNKMRIYLEKIDIVDLFDRIHKDFIGLARHKHILFHYSCDPVQRFAYTDVDKIEKITFNLLGNAFKYTPEGKRVSLTVSNNGEQLNFTVGDEGPGIEEWQKKSLFRRFENFGPKGRTPSSGIGMSLVQELVQLLHGTVEVSGKKGEGCSFSVTVPIIIEAFYHESNVEIILKDSDTYNPLMNDSIEEIRSVPEESIDDMTTNKESTVSTDKRNILIVEDNKELRHMMVRILCDRYSVIEAADGEEALMILSSDQTVDIIISDVMMPRIDGLELLQKVRENHDWSSFPFLLLSAKASVNERIQGLECGADDYLTKPFSASYLKARIKSIIDQRIRLRNFFVNDKKEINTDEIEEGERGNIKEILNLTSYDAEFVKNLMELLKREAVRSDLSIDEIAKSMGFGRTVFNRKVKSLLDSTPIELLTSIRLNLACEMLCEGKLTVSEISYKCGFSSPQYFNRVFKTAKGCTPGEYLKQNQK